LSSHVGLLIYLAVVAALWVTYVAIRKVRRERRKPPGLPGRANTYDDNFVVPPGSSHHGGHSGIGGHDAGGGGHH
jgi:hypothetical protein